MQYESHLNEVKETLKSFAKALECDDVDTLITAYLESMTDMQDLLIEVYYAHFSYRGAPDEEQILVVLHTFAKDKFISHDQMAEFLEAQIAADFLKSPIGSTEMALENAFVEESLAKLSQYCETLHELVELVSKLPQSE